LDHSGNVSRHGFAEHVVPLELDTGDRPFSETKQTKEKKESKVWECPECYQQRTGVKCPCGYELPRVAQLQHDQQILKRMTAVERANATHTDDDKAQFLGELQLHARNKGFKEGWAGHLFKQKFGVWPDGIVAKPATEISESVRKYITYNNIKRMRGFGMRRAS
jgi:hypothetical protein